MSGVELFTIGTTAVTLADAALVVGLATSAAGAISQGQAARQQAEFDAQQLRVQADRDREIARQQAQDLRRDEDRRRAALRANLGGSGVTLEGTPLNVLSDLAAEAEFQALRIEAGGETQASRAESQARLRQFEGRSAQRAGFTRAGATLLTAGSRGFGRPATELPFRTDAAGRILGGI